jgi:hypothetical protein
VLAKTGKQVFNRTVSLKDTWAKVDRKPSAPPAKKH